MSPKCPNCGWAPAMGRPKKLDDRKVARLRKKGLSIRKIAAELGVSIGAIQASLARSGAVLILGAILLQGCSSSRAVDTRAEIVPAPLSGYTCFAIVSGDAVVGGNCVRD